MRKSTLLFSTLTVAMVFALNSCAAGSGDGGTGKTEEVATDTLKTEDEAEEESANVVVNQAGGYGMVISAEKAMSCEALIAAMKGSSEKGTAETPAKIQGTVTAACQMSGCWMKMDCGAGNPMRVTFKDYGFFVPKDLAGKQVVVQGVAMKKEVSVETLRHFAKDEGKSEAEIASITEPAWEYEFVADGVLPVK